MENICLRLDKQLAKAIANDMTIFKYSTKTEFIREAIRDKLKANEKEKAFEKLLSLKGAFKGKSKFKTYDEWHDWRSNEGSKEIMNYYDKKFGLKK